ncbi:MAG: hypothetical protein ACE5PV_18585 [Candidatus Poribacteria bacterium]
MQSSHRQVKKRLYQFLRRQLVLSKGDRGEVFQLRSRQKLRRGPLPDLAVHSLAEQGVRYLILLHFANFISVYFADTLGIIVDVKNFDRKRDRQDIEELPRLARRILEYPKKEKVPAKHERLLRKTETLENQFRAKIHAIEQLVGVRLPPRRIPGIALTEQAQDGVIHIPAQLRTRAQLDRFFTTEAFRLFVPTPFQPYADPLAQVLTYLYMEDSASRRELFTQLPEEIKHMVRQLPIEDSLKLMIRPIIALLRLWARYEDRSLDPNTFHCFFTRVITELARSPARNRTEIAAGVSETLFQEQGDASDLLRLFCFLVLADNQVLHREYRTHEVFQPEDDMARFCHAMLTLRFRHLYPIKTQILRQFPGPKLARLLQRAFAHLQTQILRVERRRTQLTLVNQSDLELSDLTLRRPDSPPKEVLVVIPHLGPDSKIDILHDQELEFEHLVAEFADNFENQYRIVV